MRTVRLALAALAGLAAPALAQNTHVVPNGFANVDGTGSNAFPWGRGSLASLRGMLFWDSSHFTNAGINQKMLISRLRWRADKQTTAVTWRGGTYQASTVDIGSLVGLDANSPSTNFQTNLNACTGVIRAYTGPVVLQPGSVPSGNQIGPWVADIVLDRFFVYDPASGADLMIDTDIPPGTAAGVEGVQLDLNNTSLGATLTTTTYAATGTRTTNRCMVMEVTWVPAVGLFAGFTANVKSGTAPLAVQFTDHSYTSDPGGVLSWAWDLDGDSVIDSTAQNPSWTYATCGTWNVSLTVTDAANPASTQTRTGYISTDDVAPDFTWAAVSPGFWQLTDTTTPPANAWDWDFDGDNVTDSTLQNPVAALPRSISSVRLTATRNCKSVSATRRFLTTPASLTTQLAGGTGHFSTFAGNPGVGNFMDISVTAPEGITICGVTLASYNMVGPIDYRIYVTPDTFLNKDGNAAEWRLAGSGSGWVNGGTAAAPTFPQVALDQPFYLPAGNYGLALYSVEGIPGNYVVSTASALGPYSNSDLTLFPNPGLVPGRLRQGLFAGTMNAPRTWNGTIHYTKASLNGEGGYGVFAPGCFGSFGIPGNVALQPPRLGQTMVIELSNLPLNAAFLLVGFSNTNSSLGSLPLDLTALGAPGCFGRVSSDIAVLVTGANNRATWSLAIPNSPLYLSNFLFTQGLSLDGINTLGAVPSDAAGLVVGN